MSALPQAADAGGERDLVAGGEIAALRAQQAALQAEVAELRAQVDRLYQELGVARG